jgi:hypothetical protein
MFQNSFSHCRRKSCHNSDYSAKSQFESHEGLQTTLFSEFPSLFCDFIRFHLAFMFTNGVRHARVKCLIADFNDAPCDEV